MRDNQAPKRYLQVKVTPGLKRAMYEYADKHGVGLSEIARKGIANLIGFQIEQEAYSKGPRNGTAETPPREQP